ncbi:M16 family metallopeptidase [Caldisericum sp.]|uniref:M16 family metallopeptidase n=1 Tax=Caldisericum sp. TaxID=2499687 RepID=UPI003D10B35B
MGENLEISISKNGIRYFVEENHTFPSVSLGVFVKSGSRYETDKLGIAHFIEHMVFKETKKRSSFEISKAIEGLGGEINAYTSSEYTLFYVKLLQKDIEVGFDVLSDILTNPTFNKELLEKEREVILEEIYEFYDDPQDICQTEALRSLWGDSPLSRNPLGTEESVRSITYEDIVSYFENFFVKGNIFISAVGDIDRLKAEELVERYFKDFKEGNKDINAETVSYKFLDINYPKETAQLHLAITLKGEKSFTHESYLHSIFTVALGGNMSSRLFQKLREEHGLVYTIYAYPVRLVDTGGTVIYASTLPKYEKVAKEIIFEELNSVKEKGFTHDEFVNAKNYLLGSMILGLESTSSRMQKNGVSGLMQGYIRSVEAIIKEIEGIEKDEFDSYLKNLLDGTYGTVRVGKIDG